MVQSELRRGRHMQFEEIKHLVDANRNDDIDIFGGEPTIHPEFLKILKYLKTFGTRITLASNARFFSYDEFAKKVADIGVDLIRSSIYGHTAELHDHITTMPGSFEQSIAGFKNIIKYNIPLMVNIVILKPNYKYLKDITQMLIDVGVNEIKYASLILRDNGYDNRNELAVKITESSPYLNEALDLAQSRGVRFVMEKNPVCIAPKYHEFFIGESDPRMDPANTFSKSPACSKCRFNDKCVGVSVRYQEMFGLDELKPL